MREVRSEIPLRILKVVNVLLITLPFAICWILVYMDRLYGEPFKSKGNYLVIALFMLAYFWFARLYDGFQISIHRTAEIVYSQALAAFLSDIVLLVVVWLLIRHFPQLLPMAAVYVSQVALSLLWTALCRRWYFHTHAPQPTLIIYDLRPDMEQQIAEYGMDAIFRVVGSCCVEDCVAGNLEIIRESGAEVVFLCGIHSHNRNLILKHCIQHGIKVYMLPRIGDVIMSGAHRVQMFHLPMLRVFRYNPTPEYVLIKRLFDILFAGAALLLLSPLMLIVAIAIRRDGGPALYRQTRLTQDGKEFQVLKFRSMRVDAEKDGVARLSTGALDNRITPVGRFIRQVRIDELPQLFNILRGSMSVVGPRPERPEIAREYEKELPEFSLRLQAKAGLTGLAQVYGKYNTTPYDKLQLDLMYIANPSIIQDIAIMFATFKILFMPESTEGVAEGQRTAADRPEEPGQDR